MVKPGCHASLPPIEGPRVTFSGADVHWFVKCSLSSIFISFVVIGVFYAGGAAAG